MSKYPVDIELFRGKTLVIIGSERENAKYQKACKQLGIHLIHMTGDEGKTRLRTAIRRADILVITILYVGHNGSIPSAELAKEYNVPLASVDRNGIQYILLQAERVIKRRQVTA